MPSPAPEPRLAATIMLLRDGVEGIEVLMVVRHPKMVFASGALVFPGGAIDREDRELALLPAGHDGPAELDPERLAHRVAGIREVFEESGLLLARPRDDTEWLDAARLAAIGRKYRPPVGAHMRDFAAMLADENLVLATSGLVPFAHWITPPPAPKRFDTHFFLAASPSGQVALHDGHESVDSVWISPRRAIAAAQAGDYKLLFPTRLNLLKLARWDRVETALAVARKARVVTVRPEAVRSETGRLLRIPPEADYGGDVFWVTEPPAV